MSKTALLLCLIVVWSAFGAEIQTPTDQPAIQKPIQNKALFKKMDIGLTSQSLEDQMTKSQINSKDLSAPISVDMYYMANLAFNLQYYFNYCDRCQRLQYFSFRVGKYYLTAKNSYLQLEASTSPRNDQLLIGYQQVDGTWAFKSLTQGKYIRASNDGTTINYQTFIGSWERWYIERHGDHVHIQSARFTYCWWIFDGVRLEQMYGGASALVIEYWPKLQWLWNW